MLAKYTSFIILYEGWYWEKIRVDPGSTFYEICSSFGTLSKLLSVDWYRAT